MPGWPVRGYAAAILAMAAAATTPGPTHAPTQARAALFVLPDLLLAPEGFVLRWPGVRPAPVRVPWPACRAGQVPILIVSLPSGPSILAPN
ncbi:hypothetical protein RNZ50_13700 [Paracoccaceae bacterium Fryx2]|nr:hypothetical protein [Paracoccaceae bacterium Fryx2]